MRTRSQTKGEEDFDSSDVGLTTPTRKSTKKSSAESPISTNSNFAIDNEDDLDRLLSLAKKNLTDKKVTSNESTKDTLPDDSLTLTFARETQGPSQTFKEIQKSWQQLPKLDPGLDDIATVRIDPKSKRAVRLVSDVTSQSHKSGFRKITDPVKIAKQEKAERESNAGDKWFNMPKPEVTPQIKRDLQLLKMRNVLDPKRHYKKDNSPLPTFFQTGTIVEGNTEYFSARMNRKERRQTIADEILADVSGKAYFKRKYNEIQGSKMSGRKAHYKKIKQMRKKL